MKALEADRAAVLGLGIIGSRAAARLQTGGWRVACWNRTPKGLPGEVPTAAEAVAGAAMISLYLKDAPAVREVVGQLASELQEGQMVLNHSTVDLATTQWLDEVCRERGCRFLNVPFTGSKLAAAAGQLVYYTGGDEEWLRHAEPYLRLTGKELIPCGGVGAATVVKLATNLISACTVQALAEALAIATRHGVAPECFMRAVAGNFCSSALSTFKLPTMAAGEFETHFSLDNMRKDSVYALDLAHAAGLETPAIQAVSGRMSQLCADGLGGLDYSALAKPYLAGAGR
jgi:3-hydroxyisobutyrate dehydrogenase/glyoxylate/succinic semialdehyde reductase